MKTAIITGSTKGIGKEIAKDLLQAGYFVYITYAHDNSVITPLRQELDALSKHYKICKVDQSDRCALSTFISEIKQESRSIDCIICNAGATVRKSAWDISDEEWEKVLMISLNSHFYLIRDLHAQIASNARIIFIGSLLGIMPHATSLPYGVAKAAVHALAKNLVKEFESTGTTVNIVAPGFVETEWQKNKPLEIRKNIYAKTAIKRFASTKEISEAVMFCINNGFVNGSVIEVNGGYSYK